jgi:hypothetical protein
MRHCEHVELVLTRPSQRGLDSRRISGRIVASNEAVSGHQCVGRTSSDQAFNAVCRAEQGTIPHFKLGRPLRFDSDEIEVWLQNHRREGFSEAIRPGHRHGTDNVDALIAEAKRAVYTACHGKPDQDRATRKGDTHGSV